MNCCISGCINKSRTPLNKSKGVKFYYFPKNNIYKPWICEKRQEWIKAVKKHTKCPKNWLPTDSTRICSEHFIGNKKSDNAKHPSYVPTIFPGAENNRHKKMVQKERTYTREELLEAVRLVEQKKLNSYAAAEQFRIPRLIIADHIYYREKQESLKRKFTSTEQEPVQPEFDFDLFESEFEPKSEPDCELQRQCTQCQEVLLGFVFLCVECNARSCSACDARGLHAAHLVLRAPVARPESELELVLNKIRDALCLDVEGTQTNPDQPVGETPQETKEDYIKMEIETEEEQPIWHESVSGAPANTDEEPDVEHQSMSWAGRDASGDESDSSCTLTASTPSEDSSSDDDQALLVARPTRPVAPPTRPVAPPTRRAAPPTRPAAPSTRSAARSTGPAAPPTRPAAPSTRSAARSTGPAAPPTRPVAPPTRPVASSTRRAAPSTRPAAPPTRPVAPPTRPVASSTRPARPPTRPAAPSTRPAAPHTRPAAPPTRPPSPPGRPRFTDEMNRYIVQMYYKLSQTEKDPKKIFAQMKRAFAVSFPRTKVYRSNLQSQFSVINKKKLLSDHEIQMIRNDVCDTKTVNEKMNVSKLFTGKGRQLDLMTVRSETAETSSSISSSEKTSEVSPTPIVRTIVVPLRKPRREVIETSQEFKLPKAIQQVCTVVTESSDPKCPEQLSAALEISDSSQQH